MDQIAVHILAPRSDTGPIGNISEYLDRLVRALRNGGAEVRIVRTPRELEDHPPVINGRPYSVYLGFGHDIRPGEMPKGRSVVANVVNDHPEDLFGPIIRTSLKQV